MKTKANIIENGLLGVSMLPSADGIVQAIHINLPALALRTQRSAIHGITEAIGVFHHLG